MSSADRITPTMVEQARKEQDAWAATHLSLVQMLADRFANATLANQARGGRLTPLDTHRILQRLGEVALPNNGEGDVRFALAPSGEGVYFIEIVEVADALKGRVSDEGAPELGELPDLQTTNRRGSTILRGMLRHALRTSGVSNTEAATEFSRILDEVANSDSRIGLDVMLDDSGVSALMPVRAAALELAPAGLPGISN